MANAAKKPKAKKKRAKKGKSVGGNRAAIAARIPLFVEAMIRTNGNKTASAQAAGHKGKWAATAGNRLSKNVQVIELLAKRRAELAKKHELTTDGIVQELARIAYFDPADCFDKDGKTLKPIHEISEDARRALASFKQGEFRAFSKPEALGKAMQYLGMIKRQNITNIAQAAAAAEVADRPQPITSSLEVARRIAYVLHRARVIQESEKTATT